MYIPVIIFGTLRFWVGFMTRRVKTHIRLGIRSVSPSDQSPRYPDGESLGPYLPIEKFRGVSPRNFAGCLRDISRSFSANFRRVSPRNFAEKTLGDISDFYFSPQKKKKKKKKYFAQGCTAAKREKRAFFLGWSVHSLWDAKQTVKDQGVTIGVLLGKIISSQSPIYCTALKQSNLKPDEVHRNKIYVHGYLLKKYLTPLMQSLFEPKDNKTNKMACAAQRSLRSACASAQSDQSICYAVNGKLKTQGFGRMPRLIWVCAVRTCHFVGFVMLWLM